MAMYEVNEHGELRPNSHQLMVRLVCVEVIIIFSTMLFALRFTKGGLPNAAPSNAHVFFIFSTIAIVFSSVIMALLVREKVGRQLRLVALLAILGLGAAFIGTQVGGFLELWRYIREEMPTGHSLQLLYAIIAVHGLHVFLGLILLVWVLRKWLFNTDDNRQQRLRIVEPYWHLLTLVWIVFYALL